MLLFPNRTIFQGAGQVIPVGELARGLQLYFPMNEGGGTSIHSAINDVVGTFNGTTPTWSASRFGMVPKFNGSDNYISVADGNGGGTITPGIHMPTSPFSYSLWLKQTAYSEGYIGIIEKEFNGDDFALLGKSDGTFAFYGSGGHFDPLSSTVESLDTWYHVAITDDKVTTKFYVNGQLQVATATPWAASSSSATLLIGRSIFGGGRWFTGFMSQVGIWNRALNGSEVTALYVDPNALFRHPRRGWTAVIALTAGATIVGQGVGVADGVVYEFAGGTITGQGVASATGGVVEFGASQLVGQCTLSGGGSIVTLGAATIVGQGLMSLISNCPRDAVVTLYLVPRATVGVVMPIAYVTSIGALNNTVTCGVNQDTIPVTGSFNTLVELSGVPQNNQ